MPRKEQPITGVTQLRDGRWRGSFNVGTVAGKRHQKSKLCATVGEANRWRREMQAAKDAGALIDDEGATVKSLCVRWLALPSARRGGNTRTTYRSALENHVYPGLGSVRVEHLTTRRVQRHFDELIGAGRGAPIVGTAYKALRGALKQAVAWGMASRNACEGVVLPVPEPADPVALSLEDAGRLVVAARAAPRYGAVIELCAYTGLRVSEAIALRWPDVDLDRGLLRVTARLTKDEDGQPAIVEGAKSKSGRRTIALESDAVALLRRQRVRQKEWRLAAGAAWEEQEMDFVFTRPSGRPLYTKAVSRELAAVCAAAGLAPLTKTHALRHTNATLTSEEADHDALAALQRRLGHSALEQTMHYSRPGAEAQRSIARRLEERLRGAGGDG